MSLMLKKIIRSQSLNCSVIQDIVDLGHFYQF
jgi:hypothetical protein